MFSNLYNFPMIFMSTFKKNKCMSSYTATSLTKSQKGKGDLEVTLSKVRELRQQRRHWNPLPTAWIYLFTLASVSGPDCRAEIGWWVCARSVDFHFSVYEWMIVFADYHCECVCAAYFVIWLVFVSYESFGYSKLCESGSGNIPTALLQTNRARKSPFSWLKWWKATMTGRPVPWGHPSWIISRKVIAGIRDLEKGHSRGGGVWNLCWNVWAGVTVGRSIHSVLCNLQQFMTLLVLARLFGLLWNLVEFCSALI